MTIQGQLKEMLKTVAVALGDELRQRLVFVGGCTTALYITDPVTLEGVRATDDVDLIVDLAGFAEWAELMDQLRERGFTQSPDDNVICRMRLGELKVDFMPDDEAILGFSNRWYAKGIETAVPAELEETVVIRRLTPPLFVAAKAGGLSRSRRRRSHREPRCRGHSLARRRPRGVHQRNRRGRARDPNLHRRADGGAACRSELRPFPAGEHSRTGGPC